MGIGAYECRETVRALGGTLDVDSAPGRGTRFLISLPLDHNGIGGHAA
jgi:signal transduction histidine kinase